MKTSTITTFTPAPTLSLTAGIEAERTQHGAAYSGDRGVLVRAFNKSLAARLKSECPVEPVRLDNLEHYIVEVFKSDTATNATLVAGEKGSYKAQGLPRTIGFALRDAIKTLCVHRFKQKSRGLSDKGVTAVPEVIKSLHAGLRKSLSRLREANVLFFDTALDLPLWESWVVIGEKPDGSPEFQKDEFWTMEEFEAHIVTSKFAAGLAQWVAAEALAEVDLPVLRLPDNPVAELLGGFIARSLEAKTTRDKEAGKEVWDFAEFYTSGVPMGHLTQKPSLMGALAFVGRVVQQHNRVVERASTQLGAALLRAAPKAGEEIMESLVTLLDHYEISVGFDNHDPENGAIVSGTRELELDLATTTVAVEDYLASWKRILGPTELRMLGLTFHGGYSVKEDVFEGKRGTTTTTTFTARKCELAEFVPFADADTARYYAEQARARQTELSRKVARAFVPQATTLV